MTLSWGSRENTTSWTAVSETGGDVATSGIGSHDDWAVSSPSDSLASVGATGDDKPVPCNLRSSDRGTNMSSGLIVVIPIVDMGSNGVSREKILLKLLLCCDVFVVVVGKKNALWVL